MQNMMFLSKPTDQRNCEILKLLQIYMNDQQEVSEDNEVRRKATKFK